MAEFSEPKSTKSEPITAKEKKFACTQGKCKRFFQTELNAELHFCWNINPIRRTVSNINFAPKSAPFNNKKHDNG